MFNWLKRKPAVQQGRPRAVLPTYVTKESAVLCKTASAIRNAYEIRLMLYFAVKKGLQFGLAVRPGTQIEAGLRSHIEKHGGLVQETTFEDYSVYVGHVMATEEEGQGWVIGNAAAHSTLLNSLNSAWLKQKLTPGATVSAAEAQQFEEAIRGESISLTNIDKENIKIALLNLVSDARTQGGFIFVQ